MGSKKSSALFNEGQKYIPGGVNSPVRAFKSVGGEPLFIERAKGAKIFDADGKEYIDYVCSYGPLILGHCPPEIEEKLIESLKKGTSFGAPTEQEVELARMLVEAVPGLEMVRMVNSGTEAAMSALRLARAYTGREKIVKFEGCYHGHADFLLIKAGSGALTHGVPTSPGVTRNTAVNTISARYNDYNLLKQIFKSEGENIAAVIVEPIAGNMGVVPPNPGFLEGLREITEKYGSLLIFDEVMTGFRVAYGGAQALYGIKPDLSCFGKIIGGGLPVGAYGGKKVIMEQVSPAGPVYQAGTLSGNPLAMTAGIETLKILKQPEVYRKLERLSSRLAEGIKKSAEENGISVVLNRVGSMICAFFTDEAVTDLKSAMTSDTDRFALYFRKMLNNGVYLPPSQFESLFVSLAHSEEDIDNTLEAVWNTFKHLQS